MAAAAHPHVVASLEDGVLVTTIMREEIRESSDAYLCRDEMIATIDSSKAEHLVINLQQVQFLGSVGMVALLGVRRHLGGGRIILCNMSETVRQMLLVCRLIPRGEADTAPFETAPTVAAAVESLAS